MPQNNNNNNNNNNKKKKKKGRAPAHQNTFAFKHNPKSKKTAKILELPNQHVCRRCHDKIEWRKTYRKYKPRTQPGRCNLCQERRVMAAYHTICEPCTRGSKAFRAVKEHLQAENQTANSSGTSSSSVVETENIGMKDVQNNMQETAAAVEDRKADNHAEQQPTEANSNPGRACAMCVKEFALPDPDDKDNDDDFLTSNNGKRLTLRQRKTLERQKEQRQKTKQKSTLTNKEEEETNDDDPIEEDNSEDSMDCCSTDDEEEEEENDPFLKAVGGADKLLTGEAYQQSLLRKERETGS